jgi:hypothetical protein
MSTETLTQDDLLERVAREIDPEVFDAGPIPTRGDTEAWFSRRASAYEVAQRIIAVLQPREASEPK